MVSALAGIFGSLLGAGQGLFGSAMHYYQQKKLMKKQAEYNRENAQFVMQLQDALQRSFSKDMTGWQLLTNPAMKMEGLRAAGLNPILAYDSSSGALASENVTPAGNVSGGTASTPDIDVMGGIGSALDLATKSAQAERAKDTVDADIGLKRSQADSLDTGREKTSADIEVSNAQAEKVRQETAGIKLNNDLKASTNARDVARARAEYEADQGYLQMDEKIGGHTHVVHGGSGYMTPITPYEKKLIRDYDVDSYENSLGRSIFKDVWNGSKDVGSAYMSYKTMKGAAAGRANDMFKHSEKIDHAREKLDFEREKWRYMTRPRKKRR